MAPAAYAFPSPRASTVPEIVSPHADDGIVRGYCLADAGQDIARHDHCGAVGMTGIARGSQRSRRRDRTPGEEELSGGDFSRTTFIRTSMYDHTGYTARIGADFRVTR